MKNLKAQAAILSIIFVVLISAVVGYLYLQNRELKSSAPKITPLTWEECLKQPKAIVQESYPGVCRLPDGRSSVQPLSVEEKKKLQPPVTDETANWKSYVNNSDGYTIKYPGDIYIRVSCSKNGSDEVLSLWVRGSRKIVEEGDVYDDAYCGQRAEKYDFEIRSYDLFKETGYRNLDNQFIDDKNTDVVKREVTIGDLKFVKYTITPKPSSPPLMANPRQIAYVDHSGKTYEFFMSDLNRVFDQILPTFKFLDQRISTEKAVELVRNQKEVKEWLGLFSGVGETSPKTGGRAVINFDHMSGNKYVVHVYEELSTHTATFNWYEVDFETGAVSRTFN